VVPLASEHAARYHDLVARQRAAVGKASGGRLGYLNIPDMMTRGWAAWTRTSR
jgi:tricorn protease